MAKKKKTTKGVGESIKVAPDVMKNARIIKAVLGGDLADIVTNALRPVLFEKVQELIRSGALTQQ